MKYAVRVHRFSDDDYMYLIDTKNQDLVRSFKLSEAEDMVKSIGSLACEIVDHPYCLSNIMTCDDCDCGKTKKPKTFL